MEATVKSRWVEALRSGLYNQGKYYLKTTKVSGPEKVSYCCLGVLAELNGCTIRTHQEYMNDEDESRLGISRNLCEALAHLNDGGAGDRAFNFDEIATVIESPLFEEHQNTYSVTDVIKDFKQYLASKAR